MEPTASPIPAAPGTYAGAHFAAARPDSPTAPGSVRGALDYQGDTLTRLEHTISQLAERIGPALRDLPPEPSTLSQPGMPDPVPPCAVAQEIGGRNQRIEAAIERLQRLTAAVDL